MKRILASLLIALLPLSAFSYDIQQDGLYYNVKRDASGVYAEWVGRYAHTGPHGIGYEDYVTDIVLPPQVTYADRTYPVRGIGRFVLTYPNLPFTSLSLPATVEYIDSLAFYIIDIDTTMVSMGAMTSIRVAEDNPYWDSREDCNCLIETATNTIRLAALGAFIPASVTAIAPYAFHGTKISSPFTIPATVKAIGKGAFSGSQLPSVKVDAPIEALPPKVFAYCRNLTSVQLPPTIRTFGAQAFYESGITSIQLPDDMETIEDYTFYHCSQLSDINWPSALKVIGKLAFFGCHALTSLSLPDGVAEVRDYAFQGCHGLTSADMPSVQFVGRQAFQGCSSLQTVRLPSIKEFGGYFSPYDSGCFAECKALREVTLSDELTLIHHRCFYGCSSLETIVIPAGINRIGENAFQGCTKLSRVILLTQTPPALADNAFSTQTKHILATLYVPEGTKPAYQSSEQWNEFYFIEEFDATGINAPQAPQIINSKSINRKCFDLSGRRLAAPPARGLYIEDGTLKAK